MTLFVCALQILVFFFISYLAYLLTYLLRHTQRLHDADDRYTLATLDGVSNEYCTVLMSILVCRRTDLFQQLQVSE